MAAGKFDITIEQGATYSLPLTFTNSDGTIIDVSGWTFTGQVKANYSSLAPLASFTFTKDNTILNQVIATMSATVTSTLSINNTTMYNVKSTPACYDIKALLPDAVTVKRVIEGDAFISPAVTT
jgi:hypothetical protein